jgi:hypothetical protein
VTDQLFVTRSGIDLADTLSPIIDANIPDDCTTIDVINGIAISLTRRLGHLERSHNPALRVWVQQYAVFLLSRFAELNETDQSDADQAQQLPVLCWLNDS